MITTNVHHIKDMKADGRNGASWITITTEDGNRATLFIDHDLALAIERVFAEHNAPEVEAAE